MDFCIYCMKPLKSEGRFCPVCGKSQTADVPEHHLPPGAVLNGRFLLGAALGEGGFGITYVGRDTKLDLRVAVKEFYPYGFVTRSTAVSHTVSCSTNKQDREFFEKGRVRFLEEAKNLARFSGEPGIVDVRDFFEENNTAYIVMEFLEGETLRDHLKKKGTLSPDETLRLLTPVMHSLSRLHKENLIHRDVSPDNIMLTKNGVKLLDFGAARFFDGSNKSLSVMLKHGYAPYEQYQSHGKQGPWTDVYALCATIYRCVTGKCVPEATDRLLEDQLQPPSVLGVEIDPAVEKVLLKGLAVRPDDRLQSVDALLFAIQEAKRAETEEKQNAERRAKEQQRLKEEAERREEEQQRRIAAEKEAERLRAEAERQRQSQREWEQNRDADRKTRTARAVDSPAAQETQVTKEAPTDTTHVPENNKKRKIFVLSALGVFIVILGIIILAIINNTPHSGDHKEEDTVSNTLDNNDNEAGNTVSYTLDSNGLLTISGSGPMEEYSSEYPAPWDTSAVKTVVIKNGVTSIGRSAFYFCSNLTSVTIPNSVMSIGSWAFYCCSSLTSVTIPDSVTSIGQSAFQYCSGLTSVTIPDSVTSIGDWAFCYCTGLTNVAIPNSVTSIGNSTFESCSSLTSVTIPNSVTSIKWSAFKGCTGLTSVTIPNSVTSIKWSAFYGCSSLTSVTIPDSVTNIGDYAFDGCESLTNVYYSGSQSEWNAVSIGEDNDPLRNAEMHWNAN